MEKLLIIGLVIWFLTVLVTFVISYEREAITNGK